MPDTVSIWIPIIVAIIAFCAIIIIYSSAKNRQHHEYVLEYMFYTYAWDAADDVWGKLEKLRSLMRTDKSRDIIDDVGVNLSRVKNKLNHRRDQLIKLGVENE